MKLLFIISSLRGGGAERVMSIITNELASRGYAVKLAIMTKSDVFYELHPSINVEYFDFQKNHTLYGKLCNRLKMMSFIRNLSKREKPDVIVSFIYQMNTQVLLSTLFLGIPVIASEHNTLDKKMSLSERIQRMYIARLATKLTVLTQHDYDFLGNQLKNKVVMNNPVSFSPIDTYNDNREKVILAVGAINRYTHKGFDNLVEMWGSIGDYYPDWKLKIAGGFTEHSLKYLTDLEDKQKQTNRIEYLGQVKDISELLRTSSIFVLSSRWEGFPMVLIEAMSQGCTCISYDVISGPNEIITNNLDGILIPNQNKDAMISGIKELIENRDKRKQLSENAIKTIQQFSISKIGDRWESLFNDVVQS